MIESIELFNFISHKESRIELEDGVNVFIGPNGAGKSSVLDALTYAFYGEHTRDSVKNLLMRGALKGGVSVKFTIGNRELLAEREFEKAGRFERGTFRELAPNPRLIIAGERKQYGESMSAEVTKAIGLDYGRMKVASIITQGELGSIIRYKPSELKELFNSLIGLDRLDVAFLSMREAMERFRANLRGECMNHDDQSLGRLAEEITSTTLRQADAKTQIDETANRLSTLEQEQVKLDAELSKMEPLRARREDLESRKIDLKRYVENKVTDLKEQVDEVEDNIGKSKRYLPMLGSKESVESESSDLEKEEEQLRDAKTNLTAEQTSCKVASQRAKKLDSEVKEHGERIKELTVKIRSTKVKIKKLKSAGEPPKETAEGLNRRLREADESLNEMRDNITRIAQVLSNYNSIQDEGICPTCESTIEEINLDEKLAAKHKEHTEAGAKYKAAVTERDSIYELLEKRKKFDSAKESLGEQVERLNEHSSNLKAERKKLSGARRELGEKVKEAKRELGIAKELELVQGKLATLRVRKTLLQKKQHSLIEAESWLKQNEIRTQADIDALASTRQKLEAQLHSIPQDIARSNVRALSMDDYSGELVHKILELEIEVAKFDEPTYLRVKEELDRRVRPGIGTIMSELGGWKKQESDAIHYLSKLKGVENKLQDARRYTALYDKIRGDVFNRDGVLATSIRSWALKQLSRSASDYIRAFGIGLSEIQLKEKKRELDIECFSGSGSADVKSMSGGESVAIALALRFAMAKLMGKGMIDFIALDEPTMHLDEERRRCLVRLITEFNSDERRTLNQIIVITHDREIFENSDVNAVFKFEKTGNVTAVTKS